MSLSLQPPFNTRIITDPNYIVSASFPNGGYSAVLTQSVGAVGNTPSMNFVQPVPFPTPQDRTIMSVTLGPLLGTSGSAKLYAYLQHSADNVTFVNIPQLTPVTTTDSAGTASAVTVQYSLPPDVEQYFRLQLSSSNGSATQYAITGSSIATVLF